MRHRGTRDQRGQTLFLQSFQPQGLRAGCWPWWRGRWLLVLPPRAPALQPDSGCGIEGHSSGSGGGFQTGAWGAGKATAAPRVSTSPLNGGCASGGDRQSHFWWRGCCVPCQEIGRGHSRAPPSTSCVTWGTVQSFLWSSFSSSAEREVWWAKSDVLVSTGEERPR